MTLLELRRQTLQNHGAHGATVDELLAYNAADINPESAPFRYPLPDEDFASTWIDYAKSAPPGRIFAFLRDKLVQFQFPIAAGISQSPEYRSATLQGKLPAADQRTGLLLEEPHELRMDIHQTPAGKIPILFTSQRADFVALVRALSMRNEPAQIPDSMGACLISGYNNWDRIRTYQANWVQTPPRDSSGTDWNQEFASLVKKKRLYQDRLILVSGGFYSAVTPDKTGLDAEQWTAASFLIRREHESAHYFTRRLFGSRRNNLLDELVADYAGIVTAAGEYRQDWALLFMGLEVFPAYRTGARLENYRGSPALSDAAFIILQSLVRAAISSLRSFWMWRANQGVASAIVRLSQLTLEELAAGTALRSIDIE